MTWFFVAVVPALALGLYLFLLILLRQGWGKNRVNRFFALYLISMVIWSAGALMMYVDRVNVDLWNRVMLAGLMAMPITFFGFVLAFRQKLQHRLILHLGYVFYGVLLLTIALGYMAQDVHISEEGLVEYSFGPAVPLFAIYYAIYLGSSVFYLLQGMRQTVDWVERNRIKYIFAGLLLIMFGGISNVITLLGQFPLDIAANAVNALLIAYAISQFQLLDITFVVRKGLLYSIPTAMIGAGYFLLIFLSINLLHVVTGYQVFLLSLVVGAAMAIVFQPLWVRVQSGVDRLFFREKYDANIMIQRLSRSVSTMLDLDELMARILHEISDTMHIASAAIYLRDKETGNFNLKDQSETESAYPPAFSVDNPIITWLSRRHEPVRRRDIDVHPQFRGLWDTEREQLELLGIELFVPLIAADDLVGILVLGRKLSDLPYQADEESTLMTVANQTAMAVQNASLYQIALQEKERAEVILQEAFAGIILLDQNLRVVAVNSGASNITGYASEELLGERFSLHFDARLWDENSPLRAAQETNASVGPVETEIDGRHGRRDILLGVTPILEGYLLNFADITRLKDVDRLKSNIVANVSHELRTPLASIIGYSELLLSGLGGQDDGTRQRFIRIINSEADRLAQYINDVLDLSRMESGRMRLVPERFPFNSVLARAIELLEMDARSKNVVIATEVAPDLPEVRADWTVLSNLIKNLLSNAIKFSPDGAQVDIKVGEEGGSLTLSISDRGPGIDPEDIPHLFSKFYRAKRAVRSGVRGTGLGLALVKEAVTLHQGDIIVTSEIGSGTRFLVTMPILVEDREPEPGSETGDEKLAQLDDVTALTLATRPGDR